MAKADKSVLVTALNAVKALLSLKAEDKPAAESIMKDFGVTMDLEKATRAQDLTDAEMVADRWEEGNMHSSITREEIKVGPSQSASGSGAEKEIRDYSSPVTQRGTTLIAESLARIVPPLAASSKAQLAALKGLTAQVTALGDAVLAIGKALDPQVIDKADDEEDEDEKEFKEESEKAARKALKAAKSLVRKAKVAKSDAEDEDDKAAAKALKVEARKLLTKAGNELYEARKSALAAGNAELRKEIRDFAKAEDVEPSKEEDEEEDKGEGKSKVAAEVDKGNQSDSANKDGNQDDSSTSEKAKAIVAEQVKQLDDALKGIGMLSTSVKGLMDQISGQSRPAPTVVKAVEVIAKAEVISTKIDAMEETGEFNASEAMAARDVLSKQQAVAKGILDPKHFSERLSKSAPKVRELFEQAAA